MKKEKNKKDIFTQEFEQIIGKSKKTVVIDIEWSEKGDYFKKFSMYENYTPVKTAGHTTLIN
jgi:hypothetical protein